MKPFTLYMSDKSRWPGSLLPWLVLKHLGVPFDEVIIPSERQDMPSTLRALPAGRVPALKHGECLIWEPTAICDYLAELFPEAGLWPVDSQARAVARSISAECHSGFMALRAELPMDLRRHVGPVPLSSTARDELDRLLSLWAWCRRQNPGRGDFLFGSFSIADAMYASEVIRVKTYDVSLGGAASYVETMWQLPHLQEWMAAARQETGLMPQVAVAGRELPVGLPSPSPSSLPVPESILLTPGPLTTSSTTRHAMLRDHASRGEDFNALTGRVRDQLMQLTGAAGTHSCVLIQGSGTFAVEACIGTLVPATGKVLVLVNGAYGRRIAQMCRMLGRAHSVLETPEDTPPSAGQVDQALAADPTITHVALVHCETTSGILNPLEEIAAVVASNKRRLIVDAMSTFGALPVDARRIAFDALVSSANKCLEGVPGVAFVIARTEALASSKGNSPSLSLDLHEQLRNFEQTGQWRFTPPTHVLAALAQALAEHTLEGGVEARGARYRRNYAVLIEGMRAMGFQPLLRPEVQSPIIVTFHKPVDPNFHFDTFYRKLERKGYIIYPGKLTAVETFRVGCIGHIREVHLQGALRAIRESLDEMNVQDGRPAPELAARSA